MVLGRGVPLLPRAEPTPRPCLTDTCHAEPSAPMLEAAAKEDGVSPLCLDAVAFAADPTQEYEAALLKEVPPPFCRRPWPFDSTANGAVC